MEIVKESSEPIEPAIGWVEALGPDIENPPQARTHGRELIEPDGTTHAVASCENRIKAQFELWVQNNALRSIAQVEDGENKDPELADKLRSAYIGDFGAGHYSWEGKYVRRARFESHTGFARLLYLLMVRCNPEITEEKVMDLLVKYTKQCGELVRWAMGNSQPPAKPTGGR